MTDFTVANVNQARFECTFGRGCDGICCRNGRPPVYPDEAARITANIQKFLPELRAEARSLVERAGFLTRRTKIGLPTIRVANGWCVFFNRGCTLHRKGAEEGDKFAYKPAICALFPVTRERDDQWHVRQKGYKGEIWDLFCLDPQASTQPASLTLRDEIALARHYTQAEQQKMLDIGTPDAPAPGENG